MEATKQAFEDFARIVGGGNRIFDDIKAIGRAIDELELVKVEIIDNAERKAEVKKIIDLHPDYTVTNIVDRLSKLKVLNQWLEDNGYLV